MDANKIGSFIKELRIQKVMTQKDLAEQINCTDKAVSRWETGRGIPEVSLLMPLAKALDVSVNELLSGERFSLKTDDNIEETNYELIAVPEIITKTDKNLVSVIEEKDREIKNRNKDTLIFLMLCCIQVIIYFVLPNMGMMEPAVFIVGASAANAFLAGLLKTKIKWAFPFFSTLVMVVAILYLSDGYEKFALVFALWYIVGSVVVMLVSVIVGILAKRIIRKIKG